MTTAMRQDKRPLSRVSQSGFDQEVAYSLSLHKPIDKEPMGTLQNGGQSVSGPSADSKERRFFGDLSR
jgi:hypothetical protein